MGAPSDWSSPSDLAEYAYCPRSRYFRQRLGEPPPTDATRAGEAYHARTLRATRRRNDHPGLYWGLALVGGALAVVGGVALLR